MARPDPSASERQGHRPRPEAIVQPRSSQEEQNSTSSAGILSRPEPAAEHHAGLSASLHGHYGNTLIQAALSGSVEGPAPLIQSALTLGSAGLGPESAGSGMLSNSAVAAFMARDAEHGQDESFARDADSRVRVASARGGRPLPDFARNKLESAFGGVDFSGVRLHADGAAAQASRAINAKAYTVGEHIYFGHGKLDLRDTGSIRLLLHELTHVVQHYEGRLNASQGANTTDGGMAVSSPTDAVELEAESMATSLLPTLDGGLSQGPGIEASTLGDVHADSGTDTGSSGGSQSAAPAMRSRDDGADAQQMQAQGREQNEDEVDGRSHDQQALEQLGQWREQLQGNAETIGMLREQVGTWDSLPENERKTLWRDALQNVLMLVRTSLRAISAALEASDAGLKLGAKLQGIGSLLSLVGWAVQDPGPASGEVKDERTKETRDESDPSEGGFKGLVGFVQDTTGADQSADFGAATLGKVLDGAGQLMAAMQEFLGGVEDLRSGVDELKHVKDEKKNQAAKDRRGLDQGQLSKVVAQLDGRADALKAKLALGGAAEVTESEQTETSPTADQPTTANSGLEQEDAALNGLRDAKVKERGAALKNAPKHLKRAWAGQLEAGTRLGVEEPLRAWSKVKVLEGPQKGAWGYVDRHYLRAENREPGRAATKDRRLERPKAAETQHRSAAGVMARSSVADRPTTGGAALPAKIKEMFRPILGRAIDEVRVHTDGEAGAFASKLAANAVTTGRDIYFNKGQFQTSGEQGLTLLAEELHHAVFGGGKPGVSQPGDDHERKATAFAEGAVSGGLLDVLDATFGEKVEPGLAQGRKRHPRRALQGIKNGVPTRVIRRLGDALGTEHGSGLPAGAPGVGLPELGVGGTPRTLRPPQVEAPVHTPKPDEAVANRQEAAGATPDYSAMTVAELREIVYADDHTIRYRQVGGNWRPHNAGGISEAEFLAAKEELDSRSPSPGINRPGMSHDAWLGGEGRVGDLAPGTGTLFGGGPDARGRDSIIEGGIRQAADGRTYAVVQGPDGNNRVVWGTRGMSAEEMRQRVDERAAAPVGPEGHPVLSNVDAEAEIYSGGATLIDETYGLHDAWGEDTIVPEEGGYRRTGELSTGGVEVGVDAKVAVGAGGLSAQVGAQAEGELVHYQDEFRWESPGIDIGGESFSGAVILKVDAFVGAEARAQLQAEVGNMQGSSLQNLTARTQEVQQRFEGSGNNVTGSVGAFAGARVRLGAGVELLWNKQDPSAYTQRATQNAAAMIAVVTAPVPGLSWLVNRMGADEVLAQVLAAPGFWGAAGSVRIAWVEAELEGSAGIGANAAATAGFAGGSFHMSFGANATWGLGMGVQVGVTFGVLDGGRLGIVIAGELHEAAVNFLREQFRNLSAWGSDLMDRFWSWLSADDLAQEAVENDAHKCFDAQKRGEMLASLASGWTGGAQEDAMYEILRYSSAEANDVDAVIAASGWSRRHLRGEIGNERWGSLGLSRNAAGPMARNRFVLPPPRGGGQALPTQLQSKFGPLFGAGVGQVRIHTGSEAQAFAGSVNANAVTVGTDIFFNKSTFDPSSAAGLKLISEELHHAVVGGGGPGISQPGDAHERQALGFADRLVGGGLLETIDGLLGGSSRQEQEGGAQQAAETLPQQVLAQLQGQLPPAVLSRLQQQLGLAGGAEAQSEAGLMRAEGAVGASRQTQPSAPSQTPTGGGTPDLSSATDDALKNLFYAADGSVRYRRSGGQWTANQPGPVPLETFLAARQELLSRGKLGAVNGSGRNQGLFNTYSQNTIGAGSHADHAQTGAVNLGGAFAGTGARPSPLDSPGRDHITDFRTARDGRRYAVATGADGRNVVVWGARDSSDEDLRQRADRQLAGVHQTPARNNLWDRTAKEVQLAGFSHNEVWLDESVAGDRWSGAETVGGGTTSGSYDVLGVEAGGKTRLEVTTDGVELEAAVEARAKLVEWKQKWEWQTEQYNIAGEAFSATFFVSIDAFVGAEAKANITAKINASRGQRSIDGDGILEGLETETQTESDGTAVTTASGPEAQTSGDGPGAVNASAGAFAGAKVRLGAGLAANWHKKDQNTYGAQMENTITSLVDTASSAVPGLGWILRQIGADEVAKSVLTDLITWGPAGKKPILGVEATGEGSLGVGAQIAAKVGFSGGKLSFTWGANVTWGVGLGAKVGVTIDALEGVKLALIVGGELAGIAADFITQQVSQLGGWAKGLWDKFWGWFSADDKVREAVANRAHELADAGQRAEMLGTLMSGWTGGDDQDAMIEILRFSKVNGDLGAVLRAAGHNTVRDELDGSRRTEFDRLVTGPRNPDGSDQSGGTSRRRRRRRNN
ncbi:MAG: DUF4157 domain-containing protein [Myxococcota bacterium]|nr:DUF4157 domain-containing protein [Myxococcota bacterium]